MARPNANSGADAAGEDGVMTPEMRERIEQAYCDANMKCADTTGLYDVQPGCNERQNAARIWLGLTGVGILLNELNETRAEIARLRADRDAWQARAEAAEAALVEANRLFDYVRPILAEAYGERLAVHGLSFETAVGDACDLIDTRERFAVSRPD